MKIEHQLKHFLTLAVGLSACVAHGHDVQVHRAITKHAIASVLDSSSSAFAGFLNTISSDRSSELSTDRIVVGSDFEDNTDNQNGDTGEGGKRSYNHFYDPTKNPALGLTDIPFALTGPLVGPVGKDSFKWASTRDCPGFDFPGIFWLGANIGKGNIWSWQNARDQEWLGLTAPTQLERQTALDKLFRAVGQVMHLLEDTSQPQHVRNEQHLEMVKSYVSPIEVFGLSNVAVLKYQHAMLDWRAAGFTKMKDFWDRDLYNGSASALVADASGGAKLGLAEFVNGNFLGARHLYAEYFNPGSVEYYPFPSRDTGTDYNQVKSDPNIGLETFTLGNGQTVKGIYIKKTGEGIRVDHHSRMNYLGIKQIPGLLNWKAKPGSTPFCTIADDKVLADYHSILIPKAIEYSAGILDYFFRGRLGDCVVVGKNAQSEWTITVQNTSGETFSGGSFAVLQEAANGDRTPVAGSPFPLVGTMAQGESRTFTVSSSLSAGTKCIVVYKGAIGLTGSDPSDSVDQNIAIAAKTFTLSDGPNWAQIVWDTANFYGFSASGSASGNTVQFSLTGDPVGSSGSVAEVQGSLNYTGSGAICKIAINLTQPAIRTDFYVTILQGATVMLQKQASDLSTGANEFAFPIACSVNSTITVSVFCLAYAGNVTFPPPDPPGTISLSLTLSQ